MRAATLPTSDIPWGFAYNPRENSPQRTGHFT